MSKERLERIVHKAERTALLTKPPKPLVTVPDEDFEWLIEQAERYENYKSITEDEVPALYDRIKELESEIDTLSMAHDNDQRTIKELEDHKSILQLNLNKVLKDKKRLEQQNKRYREAIIEALHGLKTLPSVAPRLYLISILDKALEGEE